MKNTLWLLKIRSMNEAILIGGLALLLGGGLTALIRNTAAWWTIVLMGLGTAALAVFLAANLTEVREVGRKRTTVARANLTLVAVAMLAITGALNYIVARHPVRFDLTANKFFSLAPQTLDALQGLKQDVKVTMVTSGRRATDEIMKAKSLLEEYARKSTKFHFKSVDADKDPVTPKVLGVRELNTVVFESGANRKDVLQKDYVTYAMQQGRQPIAKFQGEGAFTSALLNMGVTTRVAIYFTQGHGEKDINDPQADGFNLCKEMTEKQNYTTSTLNILTAGKIPADAGIVAIIGPSKTFQTPEVKTLGAWLKGGGKMLLCVDPTVSTGLEEIFKDYGIKLGNDMVVDPTSSAYPDARAVIPQYIYHPIVEKLSTDHIASILPGARSVQMVTPALKNVTQTNFLQTTEKGWGEVSLKQKQMQYNSGADTKGPVPLAIACERVPDGSSDPEAKTRIVVFGNSTFVTNQLLQQGGNLDLVLNSYAWVLSQENKITVRPKEEDVRTVELSSAKAKFVLYFTRFVMPLTVLGLGVWVWYRRRSL